MHVLAWGRETIAWCAAQPDIACTPAALLLARHPELAPGNLPGPPRERIDEILCTWRWWHTLDVLTAFGPCTQIDADLWFWSSPEPVFAEIWDARVAVMPHGFPAEAAGLPGVSIESHGKFSRYNGGWAYFAHRAPAQRMADLVREWCYAGFRTHADGRQTYGDQGYLEMIQEEFGAHIVRHAGAMVAPWNIHAGRLRSYTPAGGPPLPKSYLVVGDPPVPIVSYHFQSLRPGQLADPHYEVERAHGAVEWLYRPYLAQLAALAAAA